MVKIFADTFYTSQYLDSLFAENKDKDLYSMKIKYHELFKLKYTIQSQ